MKIWVVISKFPPQEDEKHTWRNITLNIILGIQLKFIRKLDGRIIVSQRLYYTQSCV